MDYDDEFTPPTQSSETDVKKLEDYETQSAGVASRKAPPPWAIGHVLGDFRLDKLLGQGNSGYVFRAFDLVSERTCALKILTPQTPEDMYRNRLGFRRMMPLDHPNLVRVDRIHKLGDYVALSMEEVLGQTLARTLHTYKSLEQSEAFSRLISLARQYASALSLMHSNGLVHRDIKPQNLMVDFHNQARVIDYGLVGTFDPETDPNGFRHYLAGTPRYFAPEVLFDQHYTPAGDVFSLGLVMLEALKGITGKTDWRRNDSDRESDAESIGSAVEDLERSVPDVLRDACMEMLQRKTWDRPTALEISRLGLPGTRKHFMIGGHQIYGREQELGEINDWLQSIYDGANAQLHIYGPVGSGKSCLIDEIVRRLKKGTAWGQVFHGRCEPRGDQTLHAFGQITDQIANRYGAPDRHRLKLDLVSATIIQQAFPVLKNVIKVDMKIPPVTSKSPRMAALEAANRFTSELRKVGPLILIIENIQWADRDSIFLMDQLRTTSGGMFGIISVSRTRNTGQKRAPTQYLEIKPISHESSVELLKVAARRANAPVHETTLHKLAEAAAGYPLRLVELAQEFQHGGMLANLSDEESNELISHVNLNQLWKRRAERLGKNARKVLVYLATAGRPVTTKELATLSGLDDEIDEAITELVQQKLAVDEATGGECISMVHDEITKGVLTDFSESERREAHLEWAALLQSYDNIQNHSGRIAEHFFDADEPSKALSYAIMAAENAERLVAFNEAGTWYTRVLELVWGDEQLKCLRSAARCFREGDSCLDAAKLYMEIAKLSDDAEEREESETFAAELLLRAGRIKEGTEQISGLVKKLGLPARRGPKNLIAHAADSLRAPHVSVFKPTGDQKLTDPSIESVRRFDICTSVARPLAMFDGAYAIRLMQAASKLAPSMSSCRQIRHAIATTVFCGGGPSAQQEATSWMRNTLEPEVTKLDDPTLKADYWAAVATSQATCGDWSGSAVSASRSLDLYAAQGEPSRFERASIGWLAIASHWNLGQWNLMSSIGDSLVEDSVRNNDELASLLATSGFGIGLFLRRDRANEWEPYCKQNSQLVSGFRGQFADLLHQLAVVQREIYTGQMPVAWTRYCALTSAVENANVQLPVIRVIVKALGALIASHLSQQKGKPIWDIQIQQLSAQLRSSKLEFGSTIGNLLDGLRIGSREPSKAREMLLSASASAKKNFWLPLELAAEDALQYCDSGEWFGLLRHRMQAQGVVNPTKLERLYTVAPADTIF